MLLLPVALTHIQGDIMGNHPARGTAQINNQYESIAFANLVVAPAAGGVVTTVTIPNPGFYKVRCTYGYGGTAEATNGDNFSLRKSGNNFVILPAPISQANTLFPFQEFYMNITAANTALTINAVAAASAGAVYKGFISADRLS